MNEVDHLYIKVSSAALGRAEQLSSKGRLLGAEATNGLLMNMEKREGSRPDGGCNALRWRNLYTEELC